LSDIAKALHVDAVLEASLLVMPGAEGGEPNGPRRVRINARLIYAGTDTQLWDRTFEHVVSDVLSLQSEVATAVADGIGLQLTATRRSTQNAPGNSQAQEAYLQGRYLLLNNLSRDNFIRAREYLERSVQIDPGSARAHASLARCYTFLDIYGVLSKRDAARLAETAASAAVRLDDSLPEAHNQLASVAFMYRWDWARAERAYRRAIELNPSYSFARLEYARFLMADNRLDEALAQARRAREDDPLSAEAIGVVGLSLYYARRYDEAIAEYVAEIRMEPNSAPHHLSLGRAYAAKGQYDLAIAELQAAVTMSGQAPFIVAELARTHAAAGVPRRAQALMASLTNSETGQGPHLPAQYQSYVWAALGERDRAFAWLDKAVADRELNLLWARVDPRFDSLRQDPRFAVFLQKLNTQP
jgi:tetratricopeptide (TPR) repeat protein